MVNVLLVEGGGLVKSFWTNSKFVITPYLNSLCSFNWIRCFSLQIQNSDAVFLSTAKQLLHVYPQWNWELDSEGFPSIAGICCPRLTRVAFEYWLISTFEKAHRIGGTWWTEGSRPGTNLRHHLLLNPSLKWDQWIACELSYIQGPLWGPRDI